ncbi:MAG: hypothetical protein FJX62_03765 [Alphaproteobacteria bacterium]|nr:hypothetical protein [Alphaproteobacteria bacterium]
MRTLIALGFVAALLTLDGRPSHASYEGPWCMIANAGRDHVIERCHFRSFEACERERQFWGTAAFCNVSHRYLPNWHGRGIDPPRSATRKAKARPKSR